MRSLQTIRAIGLVVAGLTCRDEPRGLTTPPEPANSAFYLTLSSETAGIGSIATVTAHAAGARGARAVGSFAGHLRYDPGGLTFVAEFNLASGLRAFNPQPGHIRVAGAAASRQVLPDDHPYQCIAV